MDISSDDFGQIMTQSGELAPPGMPLHLYYMKPGRFENYVGRPGTPPRKQWAWGHWVDGGWASVMIARQFLIDNGHDFEIFFDLAFPTEFGGWVIMTDYRNENYD